MSEILLTKEEKAGAKKLVEKFENTCLTTITEDPVTIRYKGVRIIFPEQWQVLKKKMGID